MKTNGSDAAANTMTITARGTTGSVRGRLPRLRHRTYSEPTSATPASTATVAALPGSRIRSGAATVSAANPTAPASQVASVRPSRWRSALPSTSEASRMAAAEA